MLDDFLIRLTIVFVAEWVLIRFFAFPRDGDRDFAASAFLLGQTVFLVTFWLKGVTLSMGFAFGLFATFSILRYRTETLSPGQMTLLFLCIGIGLLDAAAPLAWPVVLALNVLLLALFAFSLTPWFLPPRLQCRVVVYDWPENTQPQHHAVLIRDLEARTGLTIERVEVESVDLLRQRAVLRVYHR